MPRSSEPSPPAPAPDDPPEPKSPGGRRRKGRWSLLRDLSQRLRSGTHSDLIWAGIVSVVLVLACTAFIVSTRDSGAPNENAATSSTETSPSAQPSEETDPTLEGPGRKGADASDVAQQDKAIRKLRRRAAKLAPAQGAKPTISIRLASFNVLGTQHTRPGGMKSGWPSGAARLPGAINAIKSHNVSIVGLQEVQPDQINGIVNGTGFAIYPGPDVAAPDRVNAVIYDPAVYELVTGTTFQMDNGFGTRAQPVMRMRHKESKREFYLVNSHPPSGKNKKKIGRRMATFNRLVQVVNDLRKDNLPVFLVGDMNDRAAFFCRVLPPTGMVASVGGSTAGGCKPPGRMPVDWVVATSDVTFSDYVRDESPVRRRISDHFFISATATLLGDD